jgi:fructokinase
MTGALVLGESLIDIVPSSDGPQGYPGGSPMNVAVGLARLGHPTTLATWIGKDENGHAILSHIEESGVILLPGSDEAERTPTAEVIFNESGSAQYVFDLTWELPPIPDSLAPEVIHLGSIGATLEPGGSDVLAAVRSNPARATITYDPNARPQIIGPADSVRDPMEAYVLVSDVVKVSHEDLAWLYPQTDPIVSARRWAATGPSLVVLTRGADSVLAFAASGAEAEGAAPPVDVVDTVGAGDSFMAALIHGLWGLNMLGASGRPALQAISPDDIETLLALAGRAASITVSRAGANPPWLDELS